MTVINKQLVSFGDNLKYNVADKSKKSVKFKYNIINTALKVWKIGP